LHDKKVMNVAFVWHMHQPEYRDLRTGTILLPWTYLHAIKDYVDMAAHLEAIPQARAVVNFTPILLEQIEEYENEISAYLQGQGAIGDPMLAALVAPALPSQDQARLELIRDCMRTNRDRMINRFEPYKQLASMADLYEAHPHTLIYASNQFLADLLVWFHISWMAESVQRSDVRIARLREKAANFTLHDRRELLQIILELLQSIVPRYSALVDRGQVELSMSPYAHPIVPLLLDMESAREALPDIILPSERQYPGGAERAQWHIQQGLATFERIFDLRPKGMWPSEGGVSQQSLELFAENGFGWVATGENVLRNSHDVNSKSCRHEIYRFGDADIDCFFRDDGLSDLIGFSYSDWKTEDAVGNFIGHLETIADACQDSDNCLITVILDGENAWEYYPENGYHFLNKLYTDIANHPSLQMTTIEQFQLQNSPQPEHEKKLVAGSWVYGTFSTWIGDPDKNRGWDLLIAAKRCFDKQVSAGKLTAEELDAAQKQLAICEGSDWFWWFGDYNPAATVGQFEQLYRHHLANLYCLLKVEAPPGLSEVISVGGTVSDHGGVMRHSINPEEAG